MPLSLSNLQDFDVIANRHCNRNTFVCEDMYLSKDGMLWVNIFTK